MKFSAFFSQLYGADVWALSYDCLLSLFCLDGHENVDFDALAVNDKPKSFSYSGNDDIRSKDMVVIPIRGIISQKPSFFSLGTATDSVMSYIRNIEDNDSIGTVLLDIHSPGGSVFGVKELSDKIYNLRKKKKVIAFINSMATSAAYWIASAADKVYMNHSGVVGGIGVYVMHIDRSKQAEDAGVKISFIKAGEYKTEGNPYEELSESARTAAQHKVDAYYSMFINAVSRNMGTSADHVLKDFGQGRVLVAEDAVAVGMVDEVLTMDAFFESMGFYRIEKDRSSIKNEDEEISALDDDEKREQEKTKIEKTIFWPYKSIEK